ncbi:TPA: transposase [Bacillus cereus]|nr:transposase [Bacillus cereus]HDR3914475.1 transposase [Bacillus cereus]HDV7172504.1 transposase [Bacillus cereus]
MTKFTSEDKINAVIHYQDGSESIKDIAISLGIFLSIAIVPSGFK